MKERQSQTMYGEQAGGERSPESALASFDPQAALTAVSEFARENPHAALGGAVAIGFVLGGGLTPRLLGAGFVIAARRYLAETVRETLETAIREHMGVRSEPNGHTAVG